MLRSSRVDLDGLRQFASLATCPHLSKLTLYQCDVREEGAAIIAEQLSRGGRLLTLDLTGNFIGSAGAALIARALTPTQHGGDPSSEHGTVTNLWLQQCQIGPEGFQAIAAMVAADPAVEQLGLSMNAPGDEGFAAVGRALQTNCTLQRLSLRQGHLDRRG